MIFPLLIFFFIRFIISFFFLNLKLIVILEFFILPFSTTDLSFILIFDIFRFLFIITVSLISLRVFLFRTSYMSREKFFIRFHVLLASFVTSIMLLIVSPNILRILIGWDGLGVRSYLLVIYYNSSKSYNSGILTFISNRVGDALIIGSMAFFIIYPSLNLIDLTNFLYINPFLCSCIIFASFTKSAQIPFSAWLPAAIAAPTPVSSLVHSSTLVTAGVYLIFRFEGLIVKTNINNLLIIFGTMTIIMASMAAFYEIDMKKMVALSTLRQLGVIVTAIGVGFRVLAFFHLVTHAFFKALLFVRAGNLIHASESYQDMRTMGGSSSEIIPLTARVVLSASISLCGLPFMSAFYSKEIIIEIILMKVVPFYSYGLIVLGITITLFYSVRFLIFAITLYERQQSVFSKHDINSTVNSSIIILFIPAVTGGRILNDSLGPNAIVLVHTNLKIFILSLIFFTLFFFKKTLFSSYYKDSLFSFWILGSIWILPYFTARLPIKTSVNLGDYFAKISDFSWLIYFFTIFNTSFSQLSRVVGFSFQKSTFIRLFSYSIRIFLFFLLF